MRKSNYCHELVLAVAKGGNPKVLLEIREWPWIERTCLRQRIEWRVCACACCYDLRYFVRHNLSNASAPTSPPTLGAGAWSTPDPRWSSSRSRHPNHQAWNPPLNRRSGGEATAGGDTARGEEGSELGAGGIGELATET